MAEWKLGESVVSTGTRVVVVGGPHRGRKGKLALPNGPGPGWIVSFDVSAQQEIEALESKILDRTSTPAEEHRYGILRKVYERYSRPDFQTWLLEQWAAAQAAEDKENGY